MNLMPIPFIGPPKNVNNNDNTELWVIWWLVKIIEALIQGVGMVVVFMVGFYFISICSEAVIFNIGKGIIIFLKPTFCCCFINLYLTIFTIYINNTRVK